MGSCARRGGAHGTLRMCAQEASLNAWSVPNPQEDKEFTSWMPLLLFAQLQPYSLSSCSEWNGGELKAENCVSKALVLSLAKPPGCVETCYKVSLEGDLDVGCGFGEATPGAVCSLLGTVCWSEAN